MIFQIRWNLTPQSSLLKARGIEPLTVTLFNARLYCDLAPDSIKVAQNGYF